MNFINQYCMLCRDKKRFNIYRNDLIRIIGRVQELLSSTSIKYELTNMEKSKANHIIINPIPHMMCVECPGINKSEVQNNLRKLKELTYTLFLICKSGRLNEEKERYIRFHARQVLAGHYRTLTALFTY